MERVSKRVFVSPCSLLLLSIIFQLCCKSTGSEEREGVLYFIYPRHGEFIRLTEEPKESVSFVHFDEPLSKDIVYSLLNVKFGAKESCKAALYLDGILIFSAEVSLHTIIHKLFCVLKIPVLMKYRKIAKKTFNMGMSSFQLCH